MSFPLLFSLPVRCLLRNKIRTSLTMLGIVIGIASVIAMMAVGRGAQRLVEARVR